MILLLDRRPPEQRHEFLILCGDLSQFPRVPIVTSPEDALREKVPVRMSRAAYKVEGAHRHANAFHATEFDSRYLSFSAFKKILDRY
jgi:hypothetical protein